MAATTILFGILMILLGVGGYFLTGRASLTAMIPAIPGALFVLLGAMARNPRLRMHAMHGAALIGVLVFVGMVPMALLPLIKWTGGTQPKRPAAVISGTIMAVLMLIFLGLCIRSFVAARKARQLGEHGTGTPPSAA